MTEEVDNVHWLRSLRGSEVRTLAQAPAPVVTEAGTGVAGDTDGVVAAAVAEARGDHGLFLLRPSAWKRRANEWR